MGGRFDNSDNNFKKICNMFSKCLKSKTRAITKNFRWAEHTDTLNT